MTTPASRLHSFLLSPLCHQIYHPSPPSHRNGSTPSPPSTVHQIGTRCVLQGDGVWCQAGAGGACAGAGAAPTDQQRGATVPPICLHLDETAVSVDSFPKGGIQSLHLLLPQDFVPPPSLPVPLPPPEDTNPHATYCPLLQKKRMKRKTDQVD
uniref:Uncharacterized protein n=1 Tax=Chromera velia CCMP2878 TaxID=1169474 RepID=A0A0G4F568_9ALVE|eukprot:Cvel_15152.t1-p1 / transcript=Cvel_15152.t1 / gene=Cvel_15152 / organism=Chromera_velia_CCMP2878 / gene_product=hypothetical protein / transcript_product=hypothetical protein / location=Cvel_scaffold1106:35703-36158(+) / protein_length=152 / sequence_SO=supercontig / SO=protein_coding / is_pseudo=false